MVCETFIVSSFRQKEYHCRAQPGNDILFDANFTLVESEI
jgi:hypothetical protein